MTGAPPGLAVAAPSPGKPATGIRVFWNVITRRLRASRPPPRRISIGLRVVLADATGALGVIFLDHLVHAHAARDHGVDVRLRVYVEVKDDAPWLLLRPPNGSLDVIALAHRLSSEIGRAHV